MPFAICVTTAPRGGMGSPSLPLVLGQLFALGVRSADVFAEPGVLEFQPTLPFEIKWHHNEHTKGPVLNSYWALRYMADQVTDDRPIMILQDDLEFSKDTLKILEAKYQSIRSGLLLGFSHEWNFKPQFNPYIKPDVQGWQVWIPNMSLNDTYGLNLQGALCVVFRPAELRAILMSPYLVHPNAPIQLVTLGEMENKHWDNILFIAATRMGFSIYLHNPSLVNHLDQESSVYPGRKSEQRRGFNFNQWTQGDSHHVDTQPAGPADGSGTTTEGSGAG